MDAIAGWFGGTSDWSNSSLAAIGGATGANHLSFQAAVVHELQRKAGSSKSAATSKQIQKKKEKRKRNNNHK